MIKDNKMKCPKDGNEMEDREIDDVRLDICNKCNGIWMDWGELGKLSRNTVTEHEMISRGKSRIYCPKCRANMRKMDLHSVIVEECRCGMFFEKGEAKKLLGRDIILDKKKLIMSKEQLKELNKAGRLVFGDVDIIIE